MAITRRTRGTVTRLLARMPCLQQNNHIMLAICAHGGPEGRGEWRAWQQRSIVGETVNNVWAYHGAAGVRGAHGPWRQLAATPANITSSSVTCLLALLAIYLSERTFSSLSAYLMAVGMVGVQQIALRAAPLAFLWRGTLVGTLPRSRGERGTTRVRRKRALVRHLQRPRGMHSVIACLAYLAVAAVTTLFIARWRSSWRSNRHRRWPALYAGCAPHGAV